jgi:hypothetical protein
MSDPEAVMVHTPLSSVAFPATPTSPMSAEVKGIPARTGVAPAADKPRTGLPPPIPPIRVASPVLKLTVYKSEETDVVTVEA